MKIHHVTQGSPEWTALRIGIPTASAFDKIITPAKGQLSKSSRPYAFLLVAEQLLGRTLDSLEGLEWIERGKELEPQAVRMYEFAEDCETAPVGFITSDDGRMGDLTLTFIRESESSRSLAIISTETAEIRLGKNTLWTL